MHRALSLLGFSGDAGSSQRAELIRAILSTIHLFISWIPLGFIFESPLAVCQDVWVNCRAYSRLPLIYLRHMQMALPKNNHLYRTWDCSSPHFIRFTSASWNPLKIIYQICYWDLNILSNISYVDDTEVFKDCLDYWNSLGFRV
ncbi:hypothetical protein P8452_66295 [Trifolium repens]|nr:hypothetical protein P8452_66295 [Trifolium repens]